MDHGLLVSYAIVQGDDNDVHSWYQFSAMKIISQQSIKRLGQLFLMVTGALFLVIESYEVITNNDIQFALWMYPATAILLTIIGWLADGFVFDGYKLGQVTIQAFSPGGNVEISFGDIFTKDGWMAVGANDFFDRRQTHSGGGLFRAARIHALRVGRPSSPH